MIRIDFTDFTDKYVGSVYTPEGDWTEESLTQYLTECVELRRRDGKEDKPFVDYLCRFSGFYPKTSSVQHFQIRRVEK